MIVALLIVLAIYAGVAVVYAEALVRRGSQWKAALLMGLKWPVLVVMTVIITGLLLLSGDGL